LHIAWEWISSKSEPCFTLREMLTLEEILLIPQNSWAGWHHSEAEIELQIGFLIEQLSW